MGSEELSDDGLVALLRDAEARDRTEATVAAAALSACVMADFDAASSRRSWLARSGDFLSRLAAAAWPGAPLWKPACALGFSLMIGLGVGALLPVDYPQEDTNVALDSTPGLDFGGDLR
jgi:hypothetical protein